MILMQYMYSLFYTWWEFLKHKIPNIKSIFHYSRPIHFVCSIKVECSSDIRCDLNHETLRPHINMISIATISLTVSYNIHNMEVSFIPTEYFMPCCWLHQSINMAVKKWSLWTKYLVERKHTFQPRTTANPHKISLREYKPQYSVTLKFLNQNFLVFILLG